MTFLKLRNLTFKKINEHSKEINAYFFLVEKHSRKSKKELITSDFEEIDFNLEDYFSDLKEYLSGKPIQKIINNLIICNTKINLDYKVLIPRLETEEFIEIIANKLNGNEKILDLCSGSGVIGLALKNKYKNLDMTLSDIDDEAIMQIKKNARLNNLKVKIIKSDLFENIKEKYDVIICNPPYINENMQLDNSVLDYEPHHALFAIDDGLYFYKKIIKELKNYLNDSNSWFCFEIGEKQGSQILNFLKKENMQGKVIQDITNKDRFIIKK